MLKSGVAAHAAYCRCNWGAKCILQVLREVKRVERLQGWQGLPRFAIGNSEGGAMALILARSLELKVSNIACTSLHALLADIAAHSAHN